MAGASGVSVKVVDTAKDTSFKRSALAQNYGIGQIVFVPCNGGVLEWGQVSPTPNPNPQPNDFEEDTDKTRKVVSFTSSPR